MASCVVWSSGRGFAAAAATILITDLTAQTPEAPGVFDALMKSVEVRLEEEYNKGRIKGTDYSKVYLGALEASMQQALAFVLGKQQADKNRMLTMLKE